METAETIPPVAGRQRAHRSAVSNGTRLFCVDGLDGRSQTAWRFRDLVETTGNDLGGVDHLSEGQKQLIRRAATLSIMAEAMEAATMNPKIDPAIIAEADDSDPEAARAEYGAEFRDDLADYITREAVETPRLAQWAHAQRSHYL